MKQLFHSERYFHWSLTLDQVLSFCLINDNSLTTHKITRVNFIKILKNKQWEEKDDLSSHVPKDGNKPRHGVILGVPGESPPGPCTGNSLCPLFVYQC